MSNPQKFNAERTAHPGAADHRWAIVYDPTPGGRTQADGRRSFSMRYPVLLLTDYVDDPENVARQIADALNMADEKPANGALPAASQGDAPAGLGAPQAGRRA